MIFASLKQGELQLSSSSPGCRKETEMKETLNCMLLTINSFVPPFGLYFLPFLKYLFIL